MTLFEKLLVLHFIGDWILQNQWMAERKTTSWEVRLVHVLIYTFCFAGVVSFPWLVWIGATHFFIDTYKPLYWFRKFRGDFHTWEEFKQSFTTPGGFFVNIVFDQIFHILCFLPIFWNMSAQ